MSGAVGEFKCKTCKKPFTARLADRNRGWARYCSKSCKAIKQERRTGQHAAHLHREPNFRDSGMTKAAHYQKKYGGYPQFDRHGEYEGSTLAGDALSFDKHGSD